MMKLKKIGALVLAIMMIAAAGLAYATSADLEENNEEGVAGNWDDADTERLQDDSINIKKVIKAYNANSSTVNAPVITYTYTVTPVTVTATVTDETTDHTSNTAVVAPVKTGLTTGLVVTGTAAGSAGDASSAVGTLVFTNASKWTTAAAGDENEYDINLDFSGVSFTQPGVYRYQIAETISATSYAAVAMEDGAYNTVYLDVYVDGNLDIYGYVCMKSSGSVTDATTKINGFVDGSDGDGTDKYYTYDLTLDKDVVNDSFAEDTHAFPFTVTFSNPERYSSTFTIIEDATGGSTGFSPTATSAPTWTGTPTVKDGGTITYTGIPAGVDVNVYETNDLTGVTYQVSSKVNGTEKASDNAVAGNTGTSTAVSVDTTAISTVDATQTVEIVNTLLLISPTGVVIRVAPYLLMLAAGVALVVILVARRRKNTTDEE